MTAAPSLERFVSAQDPVTDTVLAELAAGAKRLPQAARGAERVLGPVDALKLRSRS
jgi:hypothetical protein